MHDLHDEKHGLSSSSPIPTEDREPFAEEMPPATEDGYLDALLAEAGESGQINEEVEI